MSLLSGISKVSQGYTIAEESIPIEIHYNKLLDWLIDRKKVNKTWKKQLSAIQDKIKASLPDLQINGNLFISQIFNDLSKITSFDLEKILEYLVKEKIEGDEKNIFGQYSSKRLKLLSEIIGAFQKENIHLAQASSILTGIVNFDITNVRKSLDISQRQIADLTRKQTEWTKSMQNYEHRFKQSCEDLHIQGKDIREELIELTKELPSLFQNIVQLTREETITNAIEYYRAFTIYNLQVSSSSSKSLDKEVNVLPSLSHIIKNGDVPLLSTSQSTSISNSNSKETESPKSTLEIDWTVIDSESNNNSNSSVAITDSISNVGDVKQPDININWDLSTEETSSSTPSIDWGIESTEISVEGNANIINSNIEIEVVEASSTSGTSKQGESYLSDVNTRNLFIDDLLELREFLQQRKSEMEEKETGISFHLFQTTTSSTSPALAASLQTIQSKTVDDVTNALNIVEEILSSLENGRMRLLLEIKHSKRFVDRIVASFLHLLECAEKSKSSIAFAEQTKTDLSVQVSETFPKLESLINQAKELKVLIEKALMKQYPGRIVTLVGEVNNL